MTLYLEKSYSLGRKSKRHLSRTDPRFTPIANRAIRILDFSVTNSYRGRRYQNAAFYADPQRSQLKFPDSKHNKWPSKAIHFEPYPNPWPDETETDKLVYAKQLGRFYLLAGIIIGIGIEMKIPIRWGGDWNMDGDIMDQSFDDLSHYEVMD